jgi:hypothetical protein
MRPSDNVNEVSDLLVQGRLVGLEIGGQGSDAAHDRVVTDGDYHAPGRAL